jgi:SAM-dependent methyltransferase
MDPSLYEQHFRLEDHHWWFVARRRLVLQELARHGGESPGPILDLGCGTGGMLTYLRTFASSVGVDSAPEAAEACRTRGVPFALGWGTQLPFRDGTFGTVTALDVIEHVPDHVGILNEIHRVLRPGGLLLATVPAYQFLWSRHDELNHHQRRYRRSRLRAVLEATDFHIVKLSYYNMLLFPAAVLRKALMRFSRAEGPASHLDEVPGPINTLLTGILVGERPLVRRWDLPFGASIICAARRPAARSLPRTQPMEAAAS